MTDELFRLADEAGLLVDWQDAAGRAQSVAPESLRHVLTAMGVEAETDEQIARSRSRLAEKRRAPPECLIARTGAVVDLELSTQASTAWVAFEHGGGVDLPLTATSSGVRICVPEETGYHQLEIAGLQIPLTITPHRAYSLDDLAPGRRLWGTAVQVYSLRDDRSEPFGDFGALRRFVKDAASQGASAVAISPVHALFINDLDRYSPYSPSTRLFLNGLYADPSTVFGTTVGGSSGDDLIDWRLAGEDKRRRLAELFSRFELDTDSERRRDFVAFQEAGGEELKRHAVFEALHGHFFLASGAGGWPEWPGAYHDPAGSEVQAFARAHSETVQFHLFLQWLADRSLGAAHAAAKDAGMAIGLIADLAVGMDGGGSHAWSRRNEILAGLNVGAPPDLFQTHGQDWGVAAFSPEGLRESGYRAFIATLRSALAHAGGMRIDHAMGLRRLWMVPKGAPAADGAYLRYPFDDLLGLIALESQRARAIIVGEDLGTVPEGFRQNLYGAGVLGMSVMWFERHHAAFTPPDGWEAHSVAMTSTHDLPTVSGWWRGRDIDWRVALDPALSPEDEVGQRAERDRDRALLWDTCLQSGAAHGAQPRSDHPKAFVDAAAGLVAASSGALTIVPIEDLLGLDEQVNLPGVVDGHPNWRRRLPTEDPFSLPEVEARSDRLSRRGAA